MAIAASCTHALTICAECAAKCPCSYCFDNRVEAKYPMRLDDLGEDDDYDGRAACMSCEDGLRECDDWDCFHARAHLVVCDNCGGSGLAKDQRFW